MDEWLLWARKQDNVVLLHQYYVTMVQPLILSVCKVT